jgi:hypothetical protein
LAYRCSCRVSRSPSPSQLPPKAGEPKELEGVDALPKPPEDASFPFDAARTKGTADAAAKWVALIDAGDTDASVAAVIETFRSQVAADQWRGLVNAFQPIAVGR